MLPSVADRDAVVVIGTEKERCVATRRGSAVAFSIIHRAGVPVVGGLSRLHHFNRRDARPNSLPPLVAAQALCARAISDGRGLWRNAGCAARGCAKTGMR